MTHQLRGRQRWHAGAGAALAAMLAAVAGTLASTTAPASADSTPSSTSAPAVTSTTGVPADVSNRLAWIKNDSARLIANRVKSQETAINVVQGKSYLSTDGTTMVSGMQAVITSLQALGTKIAGDPTVSQALEDRALIFTQYRVYLLVLPIVNDVIRIDYIDNVTLPTLNAAITQLKSDENSYNEGVIGPLVTDMTDQVQIATSATSGLSAQLLAFTPAEWDANHGLLSNAGTDIRITNRALEVANKDLQEADRYLRRGTPGRRGHHGHGSPTPTTPPPSSTTSSTTSTSTTTTSTTSTTVAASPNCFASPSGTTLGRTGWTAGSNAPSSSADLPANAIDGNLYTRFSTNEGQASGLYFEVNMGSAQTFTELEMNVPHSLNDYARGYNVEVSNNGSSWTTVASCTGTGTPEIVSFPTQTAQYVEVVLTAADARWWWSIDEFNLYTSGGGSTTTS
jgi:hypothetical protein